MPSISIRDLDGLKMLIKHPKKIIRNHLARCARRLIRRHHPYVIGVTGTVGKTTTTHFLYEFLSKIYREHVYMSPHNYNGEWGMPLSILGYESPGSNPIKWFWMLLRAWYDSYTRQRFPRYLVLEYGIDRPGEMEFLTSIAEPDVAILLNISKNHLENFPSFESYAREKAKIILSSRAIVYSYDDDVVREVVHEALEHRHIAAISYGTPRDGVDIAVDHIQSSLDGISFELSYKGEHIDFSLPLVGKYQAFNTCPVVAVARRLSIPLSDLPDYLKEVHPNRGRGVMLSGINKARIIDGSYNGGYLSLSTGIDELSRLPEKYHKILLIGDMRELGRESQAMHEKLIPHIRDCHPDRVYLVGPMMREYIFDELAISLGDKTVVETYLNSRNAGKRIAQFLRSYQSHDDHPVVIYVKGSQNTIFLEEAIREFLFNPKDEALLPRQSARWKQKKNDFFDIVCSELTFGESDFS